jgi:deazaflavin-dependent oxidoreductase (nitroreductase family)
VATAVGERPWSAPCVAVPYTETGPVRRLVRKTTPTRPLTWLYVRIQGRTDRLVHRLTRGRTTPSGLFSGLPVVMLTTTGARTGLARTQPVLGFSDGPTLLVIASNYGRAHNPGWYHNLKAHPQASVTIGDVTQAVEAREITGQQRDHCLRAAAASYPGFLVYQARSPHRPIPVIRLEPVPPPSQR